MQFEPFWNSEDRRLLVYATEWGEDPQAFAPLEAGWQPWHDVRDHIGYAA